MKFDDFVSKFIDITNGIGQGNPISMLLYILYNTDLLEALRQLDEDTIGYIDDALVVATGRTVKEMTKSLKSFMERRDGGFDWALDHNSNFEISKVAVMHCQLKVRKPTDHPNPMLKLRGRAIKEVVLWYCSYHDICMSLESVSSASDA